jgi:hypothetical protein
MKAGFIVRAAVAGMALSLPASLFAQAAWAPGTEVIGQPVQVTVNGTTNTLYMDAGGNLRIVTPGGQTVPGTWQAANGQLCVSAGGAQECVPYNAPFEAGQARTLTSSCNAVETWLAQATNQPPAQAGQPERGR